MFQPPSGGPPYALPHHAASLLSLDNFMLLDATTNTFRHFNDDSNSSIKKAVHRVISTNPGDTIEIMSMILLTRAIPPGQQQPEATTTGTRIVGPSEPPNNSPDASTNVTVPEPVSIDFSKFKSPAGSRCMSTHTTITAREKIAFQYSIFRFVTNGATASTTAALLNSEKSMDTGS
eukprot:CAMPEP_0203640864 /NCGR_PEP_ID=MMETSP0088-20131115/6260_1 /ASSEMBLY_ACC=CAM_ASM_001087 /TAXON_ID=426623 /ORGANISM="Chaetoceros affinis, Strain CCMP159" /LENGTH=175 /DNA_ID=CAMNT_0050496169 /DNA_START=15 /DNA_END=540 /DNA_ORIENTATION=-